ncbi:MAG: RnfABCDGE type electron transport complex subunit D, partial [Firmicutes bacterium]|nr:RnfABCDGE type electron transport complex subunit D [Candidatus Caballimonas caccae]
MINVCIALLPTYIAGIVFFGLNAFLWVLLSTLSAVAAEIIFKLISKKNIIDILKEFDFSSVVTGLLVGLTIGTNYPWYAPIFGSVFAIIVVKMLFGGTGKNIVNPAIVGRIFLFISFQAVATSMLLPSGDAITGATAITNILETNSLENTPSLLDLFLGTNLAGCIGETCKLAIILGAIYLWVMGIIEIQYPLIYIAVCGLFQVALQGFDFSLFLPSILSGGLIIGAFFMATGYVTTPNTKL